MSTYIQRVVEQTHYQVEFVERFHEQNAALGVGHHGGVLAGNVEIALEKLAIATFARLIASIDSADLIALDCLDAVRGDVARKRHSQIVAKSRDLAALIGLLCARVRNSGQCCVRTYARTQARTYQVVDELRVFAILAGERVFELGNGRLDRHSTSKRLM